MKWSEMAPRARDVLIAERVMGWGGIHWMHGKTPWGHPRPTEGATIVFPYTTNIEAAWEVVEKMQQAGWNVNVGTANPYSKQTGAAREVDRYYAEVYGEHTYHVFAPTAPDAICLAALKAVGVDIE